MELPRREKGDQYTRRGEYPELRRRIRDKATGLNIPSVVVYAFDGRTRLLPYFFTSHHMAPAGARAVGSALFDSGLSNTRVVLQQWTPRFQPSRAKLGGEPVEMLLVSSMQIHAEKAYELITDAVRNAAPGSRPLILAGGPKAIYEPWDYFQIGGDPDVSADVVVTGEEFVMMSLIEVLLSYRGSKGTMRQAFFAARDDRALEDIPGLMYRRDDSRDAPLISTGIQRMVQDLDENPHPVIGFKLLEKPHRGRELRAEPMSPSRVRWHSQIASLSLTHGCKFNCDYCPIPAYNQRTFRHKSGERVADEMKQIREQIGIQFFFGTDDNFFNDREAAEQMFDAMGRATIGGKPLKRMVRWGTESTEFDAWKNRDLLRKARRAGLRALWFGLEDMTATLIKKGQSVNKTAELFALLREIGIAPMPMMMHHDGQPLRSKEGMYGLLNQVNFLRKAGAPSVQVTVLTPAVGTRGYEANFDKQLVFETVGANRVLQCQFDGNHVVASSLPNPWRTQLNVLRAYLSFYNPLNLLKNLVMPPRTLFLANVYYQLIGMVGLTANLIDSPRWAYRLWRGPIKRRQAAPGPRLPMIEVGARSIPQFVAPPEKPKPAPAHGHAPQLVPLGIRTAAARPAVSA